MKWLRLSTLAVSVVALGLIIGMVAVFSIDVESSVQNQVEAVTAPAPALEGAPASRQQNGPPPSNEIKDFQQLD
jgi:hypothetical protein